MSEEISYSSTNKIKGVVEYNFYINNKASELSFGDAFRFMFNGNSIFISIMNKIFIQSAPSAVYFECAPFSVESMNKTQFKFVTIPALELERNRVDITPFKEKFIEKYKSSDRGTVVSFKNLGGESILISPCPIDINGLKINPDYIKNIGSFQYMTHLVSFITGSNRNDFYHNQQVASLWASLGDKVLSEVRSNERNGNFDKVFWVSTDGRGVSWLHLRIDPTPKYYKFADYKRKPEPYRAPVVQQPLADSKRYDSVKNWQEREVYSTTLHQRQSFAPVVQSQRLYSEYKDEMFPAFRQEQTPPSLTPRGRSFSSGRVFNRTSNDSKSVAEVIQPNSNLQRLTPATGHEGLNRNPTKNLYDYFSDNRSPANESINSKRRFQSNPRGGGRY